MDPHRVDADPDADSTYHSDADPDPTFHPDANPDPDPDPNFKKRLLLLLRQTDCVGTNRNIFCHTCLHKCGRVNNCSLDYGKRVQHCIQNRVPKK